MQCGIGRGVKQKKISQEKLMCRKHKGLITSGGLARFWLVFNPFLSLLYGKSQKQVSSLRTRFQPSPRGKKSKDS